MFTSAGLNILQRDIILWKWDLKINPVQTSTWRIFRSSRRSSSSISSVLKCKSMAQHDKHQRRKMETKDNCSNPNAPSCNQHSHKYKNRVVLCSIMNQIFLEIFFALSRVKNAKAEISLTKAPCWVGRDWRMGRHDQLVEMLLVVPSKAPLTPNIKGFVTEKWPASGNVLVIETTRHNRCPQCFSTWKLLKYVSFLS